MPRCSRPPNTCRSDASSIRGSRPAHRSAMAGPGVDPADTVSAFIEAACVPREAHASGTLEQAQAILVRHPEVARSEIHTAAILADESGVAEFIERDPSNARRTGGPYAWDALTHLCFSRYLRLDRTREDAFV